jgi:hypothetical protein
MSLLGYNELIKNKKRFNNETKKMIALLRLRNRKLKELISKIKSNQDTKFIISLESVLQKLYNKEKKILKEEKLKEVEIELEQNIVFGNIRHFMLIRAENTENEKVKEEIIELTKQVEEITKEIIEQKDIYNDKVKDYLRIIDNLTGQMAIKLNNRLKLEYIELKQIDLIENQTKILNMFKMN